MSTKSKKPVVPKRAATPSKPVAGRRTYTSQFKREAVAAWSALKVKLDAEIVQLPRSRDAEYDEVIREWDLVLSWSVQHGADEEAVVVREMLAELRARREQPRQSPVTHADRLWSSFGTRC